MKKIFASILFLGAITFASAQEQQTNSTTESTQKTTQVHKKTTTHKSGAKARASKRHYGWTKGKHKGNSGVIKHTTTTTIKTD